MHFVESSALCRIRMHFVEGSRIEDIAEEVSGQI
jgi:hypothetical protein